MRVTFVTLTSGEVVSMGLLYVAAALREAGHAVRLLETEDVASLERDLRSNPTDVVAFSVTTGLHRLYLAWARAAKRAARVTTLFGGPHPTFFPEIAERPEVDAICVGEGERTAPELLAALEARDGRAVPGAIYRHEGALVRGPSRPPEQDLDRLPRPDRRLYFEARRDHREFPVKVFVASRGCPYRCSYCFNRTLNDLYGGQTRAVRLRSPADVVAEIREVGRAWPLELVWFLDANFGVSRRWLEEIAERLRRDVGLPFYCKVRPNLVDARVARALALGGCTGVGVGFETADEELRNGVLERNLSRDTIVDACRHLREAGIAVMSFNMVGLPGETYEMARARWTSTSRPASITRWRRCSSPTRARGSPRSRASAASGTATSRACRTTTTRARGCARSSPATAGASRTCSACSRSPWSTPRCAAASTGSSSATRRGSTAPCGARTTRGASTASSTAPCRTPALPPSRTRCSDPALARRLPLASARAYARPHAPGRRRGARNMGDRSGRARRLLGLGSIVVTAAAATAWAALLDACTRGDEAGATSGRAAAGGAGPTARATSSSSTSSTSSAPAPGSTAPPTALDAGDDGATDGGADAALDAASKRAPVRDPDAAPPREKHFHINPAE
jgi:hypothetical protein